MNLAAACYDLTRHFPREEMFGLTSQIRRASISVPANIAEGYGRQSRGAYVNALRIAQGSLKELETHLLLAERVLPLVSSQPVLAICEDVGRMLRGLIRSMQKVDPLPDLPIGDLPTDE